MYESLSLFSSSSSSEELRISKPAFSASCEERSERAKINEMVSSVVDVSLYVFRGPTASLAHSLTSSSCFFFV